MALKYRFNEVLDFPCDQHLRIIVINEPDCDVNLVNAVNKIVEKSTSVEDILESRLSANGKYISYTLRVRFPSPEAMEKLYEKLPKHSFVKHLL